MKASAVQMPLGKKVIAVIMSIAMVLCFSNFTFTAQAFADDGEPAVNYAYELNADEGHAVITMKDNGSVVITQEGHEPQTIAEGNVLIQNGTYEEGSDKLPLVKVEFVDETPYVQNDTKVTFTVDAACVEASALKHETLKADNQLHQASNIDAVLALLNAEVLNPDQYCKVAFCQTEDTILVVRVIPVNATIRTPMLIEYNGPAHFYGSTAKLENCVYRYAYWSEIYKNADNEGGEGTDKWDTYKQATEDNDYSKVLDKGLRIFYASYKLTDLSSTEEGLADAYINGLKVGSVKLVRSFVKNFNDLMFEAYTADNTVNMVTYTGAEFADWTQVTWRKTDDTATSWGQVNKYGEKPNNLYPMDQVFQKHARSSLKDFGVADYTQNTIELEAVNSVFGNQWFNKYYDQKKQQDSLPNQPIADKNGIATSYALNTITWDNVECYKSDKHICDNYRMNAYLYKVNFKKNLGTDSDDLGYEILSKGQKISDADLAGSFADNAHFQGWYLDADCTQPVDATNPFDGKADSNGADKYQVTLYAKWDHEFKCVDNGDGTHTTKCMKEGCTVASEPEAHKWGEWVADEAGENETSTCTECGAIKTQAIEKEPVPPAAPTKPEEPQQPEPTPANPVAPVYPAEPDPNQPPVGVNPEMTTTVPETDEPSIPVTEQPQTAPATEVVAPEQAPYLTLVSTTAPSPQIVFAAPATAAPASVVIADDAVPMAAPQQVSIEGAPEMTIADDAVPMAAGHEHQGVCLVHFWIFGGIILTAAYASIVIMRRMNSCKGGISYDDPQTASAERVTA